MPQEKDPFEKAGGYMNVKISKLENQVSNSSNFYKQSNLFEGISIFVNGWTNPTSDDLKRIMMAYGGTFHHYERKHTTFVVAENLPDVKIRNMNTSNVISPKWVVDCVKADKILDYSKYLLYTNRKRSQPSLFFKKSFDDDENSFSNQTSNLKRKKLESNAENDDSSSEDEPFQFNSEKSNNIIYDPDIALQILNNKICAKSELKIENDTTTVIKKSPEPNNTTTTTTVQSAKARTANDPKFLSEFYNNSRLHHIATLGAGFKQYVNDLREAHTGEFPARKKLIENLQQKDDFVNNSTVMHIDMDCFFVSVGLRTHSHLKGYPIAVTHSKGGAEVTDRPGVDREHELNLYMKRLENRLHDNVMSDKKEKIRNGFDGKESLSEIASCSYEARKKGVKNGMFVGQALKLCPDLKTIPYDFEGYREVAFQLYDTIAQYTLDIEAVSCDEMFVDLTSLLNNIKIDVMDFVTYVRDEVKMKTECPCSAGIGGNRLQARMATKKAKPDGQYYLEPNTVLEYISNIPIKDLPGVGYSTNCALQQLDLRTCGDLQNVALQKLQIEFGKKFGETLYQFCRGIDNKPLVYGQIRKSVSAEVNYGIRFTENIELEKFLKQLCEEVHSRLMKINRRGKCITLKVMIRGKEAPVETAKFMGHGFCDSMNKSVSLSDYTCDLETITRTVLTTMKALNLPPKELRGLGIQISKLDDPNDSKKTNVIKNMFNKVLEKQKEKGFSTPPTLSKSDNKIQQQQSTNNLIKKLEKEKIPPKSSFFQKQTNIENDNKTIKKSPNDLKPFEKSQNKNNQKTKKTPEKLNTSKSGRGGHNHSKAKSSNSTNAKPSQNILTMFQNVTAKKSSQPPSQNNQVYQANEIDPNILAELPEELQREILNENRISIQKFNSSPTDKLKNSREQLSESCATTSNSNVNKKIEIDMEFLNALPENLRNEIENEIKDEPDKYLILKKNNDDECNILNLIEPNQNDLADAGSSIN